MKVRKIRKIQTIFSVVILLTNPFLGLNVISYAETDDVLEAQTVEQTQSTESEAEVPTEQKEVETPPSSETLEETDNEGFEPVYAVPEDDLETQTVESEMNPQKEFQRSDDRMNSNGYWGTAPYDWNPETGVLTFQEGEAGPLDQSPWKKDVVKIPELKKIVFSGKVIPPINCAYLFADLTYLTTMEGMDNFDVSNVTDMNYMFYGAMRLSMLDVSSWDTSNVTNMSSMFSGATNLSMLDVSSWDTSNVTNMGYMFYKATNLSMLDVSSWDTSKVTDMGSMFSRATNLSMLDVSSWDTSKVTDMSSMFYRATNLSMLDVSFWDTSKVTNMGYMFSGTNLSRLTLGNKFRFQAGARLGSPTLPPSQEGELTGKWIREDGNSEAYSPTEFMENYGTGDLTEGSYIAEVKKALITTEANPQTFPLGTDSSSLDTNKFVKNVKLGDTSLTKEQYSVKLVDTVTTDIVGKQTVKVEISLNSDSAVKTTVEVPVEIEWGNSIVFKDDFNNNGFRFTAASISLLKGPNGPQLVATRGDGFRNAGSVLFYARPDITIYSKSLDTVVTRIRETTSSQHPNDVRNRWNGLFEELGDQLNYGDILGIKVNQSYGSNANQNGKNTWVSRNNELVTETEGFDTAYYELTEEGLKLLELSAHPNKQSVDYGTDVEKIDYTDYVKDVKIGEVVVPKEQYTTKLVGEFDTSKPGEQTIKVEVTLKEDPTHKIQVDVPVEIEGTLTIEVPDT
ncbi:BspA family leucine-rich repeat surface protein, partial [Enterococcus lactis]|uniref:BspA family leucine-rich repeat surface protein n=1 Tax=Enterococcus lactis TaxID=357441 RepID=UPI001BCCEB53